MNWFVVNGEGRVGGGGAQNIFNTPTNLQARCIFEMKKMKKIVYYFLRSIPQIV